MKRLRVLTIGPRVLRPILRRFSSYGPRESAKTGYLLVLAMDVVVCQCAVENARVGISGGGSGTDHVKAVGDAVAHADNQVSAGDHRSKGLGDREAQDPVSGRCEMHPILVIAIWAAAVSMHWGSKTATRSPSLAVSDKTLAN